MKKLLAFVLAALLLAAVPAFAAEPSIKRVEYEGAGHVDVDFVWDVEYMNASLSVQDEDGAAYAATIWELDEDDLTFGVEGVVPGKNYSFTLSGVRSGFTGDFTSVSGSFSVPEEGKVVISKTDYDADDRELEIEFAGRVEFENPVVTLTDEAGNAYENRVSDWDKDSLELRVSGLKRGTEYRLHISGVRAADAAETMEVSGSFTAR